MTAPLSTQTRIVRRTPGAPSRKLETEICVVGAGEAGTKFADAIGRTAWPIELHDHSDGHHWIVFDEEHVHYIPFGSLVPEECTNVVAAGRCIDADAAALSSVRVMGPCIAMGMAAAAALDLAGSGSVHEIDPAALDERVEDNVGKRHYRWQEATPGQAVRAF